MKKEIQTLDTELKLETNSALDAKWEAFFSDGSNYTELYNICKTSQFPQLAKRIELLDGNYKFDPSFKVDEAEMLMDIFAFRKNADQNEPLSFALR